ncbi:unnamed protein product [Caenorhabditis auriculariae]|uniref:Uncharacterized protein n=1 Tax=Caenorhabditis auriculariae TaxID=2777116 RepID=A0A8S1GPA9_9PELO|nr:unnamed protein product [Caenorhabditis auriculariae]
MASGDGAVQTGRVPKKNTRNASGLRYRGSHGERRESLSPTLRNSSFGEVMDEADLYDLAFSSDIDQVVKETPVCTIPTEISDLKKNEVKKYAKLLRDLIIVARRKVKSLETEILNLNLKLEASGAVCCPNCTHYFKDRQCTLTPKYSKIFRASNRVELEFNSLEDLNVWLHLNMLDVNSDGLPTLMPAAKTENKTLKSVSSKLPELVNLRFAAETRNEPPEIVKKAESFQKTICQPDAKRQTKIEQCGSTNNKKHVECRSVEKSASQFGTKSFDKQLTARKELISSQENHKIVEADISSKSRRRSSPHRSNRNRDIISRESNRKVLNSVHSTGNRRENARSEKRERSRSRSAHRDRNSYQPKSSRRDFGNEFSRRDELRPDRTHRESRS